MEDPVPDAEAVLTAALGAEGAKLLAPHVERVALAEGDVLLTEGVRSSSLWVIADGEVAVRIASGDGDVEVARHGPGAWLGEVGFVDGGPAMATVVAAGPAVALRLDHATLLRLGTDEPAAAAALLRHVTRKLAERVAAGSAGVIEEVAAGHYRVRKPEEVRGWLGRVLQRLFGEGA